MLDEASASKNGSVSPHNPAASGSSAGISPAPPSFNTMIGMSETSASVDLDRGLSRHLVQEYFNCLHMACVLFSFWECKVFVCLCSTKGCILFDRHPAINWNPFWDEVQSAGFDAMAMDTETGEVLCLTCQAFGARVSDHEQIVGPGVTRKSLQRGVVSGHFPGPSGIPLH